MTKIKNDMKSSNVKMDTFYIKLSIGQYQWNTSSFKIVSSCSQLPADVKEGVRPPKKDKKFDS